MNDVSDKAQVIRGALFSLALFLLVGGGVDALNAEPVGEVQGDLQGGARRLVNDIQKAFEERRWDVFLKRGVEALQRSSPGLLVLSSPTAGLGLREWMRDLLSRVPPDVQRDYQAFVTAWLANRPAAMAERERGSEVLRLPASREEFAWRAQDRQRRWDEGEDLHEWLRPRITTCALTLGWSAPWTNDTVTTQPMRRVVMDDRHVFVSDARTLATWDRASGRLQPPQPYLFPHALPSDGRVILWNRQEGARANQPQPPLTLSARVLEFVGAPDGEGYLLSGEAIHRGDGHPLSFVRWISKVRLEPDLPVQWHTSLLSQLGTNEKHFVHEMTIDESLFTALDEIIVAEERKMEEALRHPDSKQIVMEQYGSEEHWRASLQSVKEFLATLEQPLETVPLLAAGGDVMIAAFPSGTTYALEAADGHVRWFRKFAEAPRALATDGRRVFVGSGTTLASVRAWDASTGRPMWTTTATAATLVGVSRGTVVVAEGRRIAGLDAATGRDQWTYEGPDGLTGTGCVTGGRVWLPMGSRLILLDGATGVPMADMARPDHAPGWVWADGRGVCDVTATRCSVFEVRENTLTR